MGRSYEDSGWAAIPEHQLPTTNRYNFPQGPVAQLDRAVPS